MAATMHMKALPGARSVPCTAVKSNARSCARFVRVTKACAAPASTGFKNVARHAGAALAAGTLWASVALGAAAVDLSAGEEVFTNKCAACHTGGANVVQAEKTLQKDALVQYLEGGFKVESIVTQVTSGKNAMPAWAGRLSEEEIQDVAAYVFNQATNDLW